MTVEGTGAESGGRPQRSRVVVGVDGSAGSLEALAWAVHEARLRRADLEVVHVRFFRKEVLEMAGDAERSEESTLDRAVARARIMEPEVRVLGRLADPPADDVLVAASRGAALLVVGSRGLGGLKELTLGSVSQQCAHRALCPVVIVRP